MKLPDARALQKIIHADGLHCVVPTGKQYKPDGYFARITTSTGPREFYSLEDWEKYREMMIERDRKAEEDFRRLQQPRRRSPIEIMIDRACGLE